MCWYQEYIDILGKITPLRELTAGHAAKRPTHHRREENILNGKAVWYSGVILVADGLRLPLNDFALLISPELEFSHHKGDLRYQRWV